MKAVVIDGFGGVDQLHIQNVDDPPVGRGEVLVRVRATSVNPVDLKICSGSAAKRMGVELPAILGRDLTGEVARGEFTIPIAKTLSLSQIQEAHREAENHPSGKIVLKAA
jgi:NADPH:quinone reductase-like Zn-dependent oxidoreductase